MATSLLVIQGHSIRSYPNPRFRMIQSTDGNINLMCCHPSLFLPSVLFEELHEFGAAIPGSGLGVIALTHIYPATLSRVSLWFLSEPNQPTSSHNEQMAAGAHQRPSTNRQSGNGFGGPVLHCTGTDESGGLALAMARVATVISYYLKPIWRYSCW